MSLLVECAGCETRYDLRQRRPGARVRCPRCRTILVVPAPDAAADPRTTSSGRLRRARGPCCVTHPRQPAESRCIACQAYVCARCRADEPVDHFCRACAAREGLHGALPVDFGFGATTLLAARALGRALPRVLVWFLLSAVASSLLWFLPIWAGVHLATTHRGADPAHGWQSPVLEDLGIALGLAGLVAWAVTHYLLLVPAGSTVFLDQAVRGQRVGWGAAFGEAWARFRRNAVALVLSFLILFVVLATLLVPVLAGTWWLYHPDRPLPSLAFLLATAGPWLLVVFTGLGLAIPVVILEQRPAIPACLRAWELARQRFFTLAGLVVLFFAIETGVSTLFVPFLEGALPLRAAGFLLSHTLDVIWPALLVAAYHGLAAEHAGVPGRV